MLLVIRERVTPKQIKQMAEDISRFIKVVVDVRRGILAGGGKRHVEGEQKLLEDGSKQEDLWGGGLDLDSEEIDYNSIINVRPRQQNFSRDIMSQAIREVFDTVVKRLLMRED